MKGESDKKWPGGEGGVCKNEGKSEGEGSFLNKSCEKSRSIKKILVGQIKKNIVCYPSLGRGKCESSIELALRSQKVGTG